MLTRLLQTGVALVFLLGGATVAMEAVGLIFHVAPTDPERRMEAVVGQLLASVDPRDVPSEAEGLWPPPGARAEREEAAGALGQ